MNHGTHHAPSTVFFQSWDGWTAADPEYAASDKPFEDARPFGSCIIRAMLEKQGRWNTKAKADEGQRSFL